MAGTHRVTHISFPNMEETSYHDITSGIAEGSLLLDELLLREGLNFGEVNSNKFEVQLYNISDVTDQKIVVWQVDTDNSEEIPIFTGYVDSCKQNRSGYYREIVAYDAFYKKNNENISHWWADFWDTTGSSGATLKTLRTSLLSYMNIETVTLPSDGYLNDNLMISRLAYEPTLTFGVLLKMICELQATIPNINREGKLEFIVLGTNYTDESANVNTRDSLFEEFSTIEIDAVWIYDQEYNIIGWGGAGTNNAYKIYGNLLINGVTDLDAVATALSQAIGGITYTPGDIVYIVSNPDRKLGDRIYFGNGYTYLFEIVLSGPILIEQETRSEGEQYLQESSNWNSDISNIQNKITNNEIQYYIFTNMDQITVSDGDTQKIIDIRFASNKPTVVVFEAEISLIAETTVDGINFNDAICHIQYRYNDVDMDFYEPDETWLDGKHMLHLLRPIEIRDAIMNKLEVLITMSGGSIIIPMGYTRSIIYGQNLAASDRWDGNIDVRQESILYSLSQITNSIISKGIIENLLVVPQVPQSSTISQEIGLVTLSAVSNGVTAVGIEEEISTNLSEEV